MNNSKNPVYWDVFLFSMNKFIDDEVKQLFVDSIKKIYDDVTVLPYFDVVEPTALTIWFDDMSYVKFVDNSYIVKISVEYNYTIPIIIELDKIIPAHHKIYFAVRDIDEINEDWVFPRQNEDALMLFFKEKGVLI